MKCTDNVNEKGFAIPEALYNHKATIADFGKNIIGFPTFGNTGLNYFVYSYEDGKFVQKLKAGLDITRN